MIFTSVTTNLAFVALVITNSIIPHPLLQFDGLYYKNSTTNLLKVIDNNGIDSLYGEKYICRWCESMNVLDLHQLINSSIKSMYLSVTCPKCSKGE